MGNLKQTQPCPKHFKTWNDQYFQSKILKSDFQCHERNALWHILAWPFWERNFRSIELAWLIFLESGSRRRKFPFDVKIGKKKKMLAIRLRFSDGGSVWGYVLPKAFTEAKEPDDTQLRFQVRKDFKISASDRILICLVSIEKDNVLTSARLRPNWLAGQSLFYQTAKFKLPAITLQMTLKGSLHNTHHQALISLWNSNKNLIPFAICGH